MRFEKKNDETKLKVKHVFNFTKKTLIFNRINQHVKEMKVASGWYFLLIQSFLVIIVHPLSAFTYFIDAFCVFRK
jgi:hypothetical protein